MSPEPTILIYNTRVINASQKPHSLSDVASLGQTASLKGKIVTYPMDNSLGYAATWAYTTQKGAAAWTNLEKIGPAAKTELEGQSQGQGLVQGTYASISSPLVFSEVSYPRQRACLSGHMRPISPP
jgi:hypothetical protein